MEANKYQALDDAICEHIRAGRGHPTKSSALEKLARPLLATNRTAFPEARRLIDRRMQSMRKAGRLVYGKPAAPHGSRWRVIDA